MDDKILYGLEYALKHTSIDRIVISSLYTELSKITLLGFLTEDGLKAIHNLLATKQDDYLDFIVETKVGLMLHNVTEAMIITIVTESTEFIKKASYVSNTALRDAIQYDKKATSDAFIGILYLMRYYVVYLSKKNKTEKSNSRNSL